jgi:photosystem II stability/assembly factor-like uncharacterized protein
MRNLSVFVGLFLMGITSSFSQITTVSTSEYGRIFDLVYDQNVQNKVYAVSEKNHILVSNDNAVTWDILYSYPSGRLRELRLVNDTSLSFFLTQTDDPIDETIHLLNLSSLTQTTINRPLNSNSNVRTIQDYSIYENNPDIMLYKELYTIGVSNYNRVHYTVNGGQSWTMVYDEIANNEIAVDKVLISYNNPDRLFISRDNGPNAVVGGLLVSEDAGANWVEYFAGTRIRGVAVDPFDTNHWMIGTTAELGLDAEVYHTFDAGANWTLAPISFDNFASKAIWEVIFHPTIQDRIFILETNEIAISSDGGSSWSVQVFDPFVPGYFIGLSATFNPYDTNEVLYTSNWYPFRSIDGGVTLQKISTYFGNTSFASVSPKSTTGQDRYLYYGLQRGIFSKNLTTNNETNFGVVPIDQAVAFNLPVYVVDKNQYGRIFSSLIDFNGRTLNVSTDHGQSFNTFYTGYSERMLHIESDPVNTSEAWVGFEGFLDHATYIIDVTSVDPWSPTISQVTMPTIQYHTATWINPNNNQEVLAALGGEVWSTTDRGVNWTNSSSGLTLDIISGRINSIVQSPIDTNEFMLATSNGVWKSSDRFATWTNILTQNNVHQVLYDENNPSVLVVAVYESNMSKASILYSKDFGNNWTTIPTEELLYISSVGMGFDFMDSGIGFTAYVSTYDLGVLAYEITYDPVGIEHPKKDVSEISIYPNPVTEVMNVTTLDGSVPSTIVIYNTLGAEINRYVNQSSIDLSQLQSGIYLVKVQAKNGNLVVKSIVKN